MESDLTPAWNGTTGVAPPPAVHYPVRVAKPLELRPLWVGLLFAAFDFLFAITAHVLWGDEVMRTLAALLASLFAVAGFVYYFMSIYRLILVMRSQPGWKGRYTPGSAVLQQFIPLLGIIGIYRWTGDVECYTNRRLGRSHKWGLAAFLAIMAGALLSNLPSLLWIGQFFIAGSLGFLYVPVRQTLSLKTAHGTT